MLSMDMPQDTPEPRARMEVLCAVCAGVLVLLHFFWLLSYYAPAIATPDANSYFTQARLIAARGEASFKSESPIQYSGPFWTLAEDGRYYCMHAPGLSVLMAVPFKLFGPAGAVLTNPVMASLTLLGLFLLTRAWLGASWGLLAAGLMASYPIVNEHALSGDAHVAVAFLLVWSLYFTVRWSLTLSAGWAVLAGLFAGMIPLVRYPEGIYLPGIAAFVLLHLRRSRACYFSLLAGTVGLAIPLGAMLIRNHLAFGAFWRTGYALLNAQSSFGWGYFQENWAGYLRQLLSEGGGLMFALGLVAIIALCGRRETWRWGVLLALLTIPTALLYAAYFWRVDAQSMRYLLPSLPIYTLAGVWLVRELTRQRRAAALALSVILVLLTACWGIPQSRQRLARHRTNMSALARVTQELKAHAHRGDVVVTSEGIAQDLDFVGQWKLVSPRFLSALQPPVSRMFGPGGGPMAGPPGMRGGGPGGGPPGLSGRGGNLGQRLGIGPVAARRGFDRYRDLARPELFDAVSAEAFRWAGGQRVYVLGKQDQLRGLEHFLSRNDRLVLVSTIELLAPGAAADEVQEPQAPLTPGGPRMSPIRPSGVFDLQIDANPLKLMEWVRTTK
jgi:4-amino-4-deoxy-L-arabinose transferase-like glycosyltransferase